jgi:hypothetical protein
MKNVGGVFVVLAGGCGTAIVLGILQWIVNIRKMSRSLDVNVLLQQIFCQINIFCHLDSIQRSFSRRSEILPSIQNTRENRSNSKEFFATRFS